MNTDQDNETLRHEHPDQAVMELRRREQDIKLIEIKSQRRIEALKIITTGIVVTLVPAIISWRIQNQQVEIERVKSEQSYLKDFSEKALQEDLNKRYNFADYLATVALSDRSRDRWQEYRDKIKNLFVGRESLRIEIRDLKGELTLELNEDKSDKQKIENLRIDIREAEQKLKVIRDDYNLYDAPVIAPSLGLFEDKSKFQVRNLNLNEQGNAIWLRHGGEINATMQIKHDCPTCEGAINQIIVGIGGEERAQACVWIGQQSSGGWQTVTFTLTIPSAADTYKIRTRYAQASVCDDALGWWKTDRPNGPTAESDIGVVVSTDSPGS